MQLTTDTTRGTVIVTVAGDVDLSTASELEQHLTGLLAGSDDEPTGSAIPLIVDLSEVDFLDSSALGALVAVHKRAVAAGGSLKVACSNTRIERVFTITRLSEVVGVYPSIDAAING